MNKILIIVLLALAGCGQESNTVTYRTDTICQNPVEVMKSIVDCSKAANPLSDEEGEDLVRQCQITAERILCKQTEVKYICYNFECVKASNYNAKSFTGEK